MINDSPTLRWTMRRLLAGSALSFVVASVIMFLLGSLPAVAEPPLRAASQITDNADALGGAATEVQDALGRLREDDGTQLFVVFVSSFDGLDGQTWADRSAEQSQLGSRDVLFAVAIEDRAYGLSVDDEYPLSDEELADLTASDVEPLLSDGDWAGAAIALADGLADGGSSGGGGTPIALVLGGVAVAGGGYVLYRRRRRSRGDGDPATRARGKGAAPQGPPDPHAGVTTEQLTFNASSALIDLDDAMETSARELTFARGQFGDEAVTGFQQALDTSRAELTQAFTLRQQLDDEVPEDEPTRRKMVTEILRLCHAADQRLDAQSEAFDRLRDLDHTAPAVLEALSPKVDAAQARIPAEQQRLATLQSRYAATALRSISDSLTQAETLLATAKAELDEARTGLQSPTPSAAVVSLRTAEDATAQGVTLLDGLARLHSELDDAAARISAIRSDTEADLAEARALTASGDPTNLGPLVARAEAGLVAADAALAPTGGALPDPITALRQLTEADVALDEALVSARDAQIQAQRTQRSLDQALLTARSTLAAAADFITTRRAAIGSAARTRLAEGQRHLERAMSSAATDPAAALREAQQADALGTQALQYAQADVGQYSDSGGTAAGQGSGYGSGYGGGSGGGGMFGGGGGRGGPDLGSLILGGILFGGGGGGGGRGGFGGGGFGGGGGRSTGSFGGSASRGRRGGGGRF